VHGDLGERQDERRFAAGTLVVPAAQPQARLVRAYLELDPRMDPEFLLEERKSLERDSLSKIYDVTASDLGRAFDLRCSWATPAPGFGRTRVEAPPAEVPVEPTEGERDTAYAWIVDGLADRSVRFAARAMELGVQVHLADEEFDAGGGRAFARGSLVVRRPRRRRGPARRGVRKGDRRGARPRRRSLPSPRPAEGGGARERAGVARRLRPPLARPGRRAAHAVQHRGRSRARPL
jgi:hypothetical protein